MASIRSMNFLSHFYFDRNTEDHYQVLGIALPDLLKNANKDWNIRPEKNDDAYTSLDLINLYSGWKRHILVDKYFHGSTFFFRHSRSIRKKISPCLAHSPAKPFFVAHIALEIMLDSLLLTNHILKASDFYAHLEQIDKTTLSRFLEINGIDAPEEFIRFLNNFLKSKYLDSYRKEQQIVYAINSICSRLWKNPFNEQEKANLTQALTEYMAELKYSYLSIFDEIDEKLNS